MNFEIPVETYIRLCGVSRHVRDLIPDDEKKQLRCVRLEHKSGKTFAIASNRKIAAIYYLGNTAEPDGAAHLNIDDALLKQCETEKPFNSTIQVVAIPELNIISIKTTLGFSNPAAGFFDKATPLANWSSWVPPEPITANFGAMAWHVPDMVALNAASPSGIIVFPAFIDASEPVVVRDEKFPNFVGLFMPNLLKDDNKTDYIANPATLPEWWV